MIVNFLKLNKNIEHFTESDGFRLGEIEYEYQPNLLNNTVIDQSYPQGLKVTIPVKIDIVVSKDYHDK